jgi:hypothetical protein
MKEGNRREERKKTGKNNEVTDKIGGQGTTDGRMREGVKEEGKWGRKDEVKKRREERKKTGRNKEVTEKERRTRDGRWKNERRSKGRGRNEAGNQRWRWKRREERKKTGRNKKVTEKEGRAREDIWKNERRNKWRWGKWWRKDEGEKRREERKKTWMNKWVTVKERLARCNGWKNDRRNKRRGGNEEGNLIWRRELGGKNLRKLGGTGT